MYTVRGNERNAWKPGGKMTIRTLGQLTICLGAIVVLTRLATSPCLADVFLIQDSAGGSSVTGVINACPTPEFCEFTAEFGGQTITSSLPLNFNIYKDASLTVLSDTLALSQLGTTNNVLAIFNSDVNGTPPAPLSDAQNLIETGGEQTAATVMYSGGSSLVYEFQSDEEVPEPSFILILVIGSVGMALLRLRLHAPGPGIRSSLR
jgi:hypothetical protein